MRAQSPLRGLPREIVPLLVATFLNRTGNMGLPFLVLYLTAERRYSVGEAGAMLLLYALGAVLAAPAAAHLVGRLGAVSTMRATLVCAAVLQAAFPFARGTVSIGIVLVGWAFAAEVFRPVSLAYVADLVDVSRRKPAYSALRLAGNLGTSVGPAVGGVVAARSFPALFFIEAATSAVAVIPLLAASARRPITDEGDNSIAGVPASLAALVRFLVPAALVAMVFYQSESTMALYLVHERGLTTAQYGLLFTVNTGLVVILELPLSSRSATFGARGVLTAGALVIAVGFAGLAMVRTFAAAAACVVIWTFGEMLFAPTASTYVAALASGRRRATYLSAYHAAWSVALGIGPAVGALSYATLGGRGHWLAVGGAGVLAAVGFALGVPNKPRR